MKKKLKVSSCLAALLVAGIATAVAGTTNGLLAHYPAEGNLAMAGNTQAVMTQGRADALRFVPGKKGQGVYLPLAESLAIPVAGFNPAEGTLSFWFRPDWSAPNGRANMIIEVDAQPAYRLSFRKGYSHVPDHCYLTSAGKSQGEAHFGCHNLFTGRTWRHYAIRWSKQAGTVRVTVDGDTDSSGGSGKFMFEGTNKVDARVLLSGDACGAFDEVKVFNRWLEVDELEKIEGFKRSAYLQRQSPPPGAGKSTPGAKQVSYVDPATGRTITGSLTDEITVYNPANMPELPETPHTKWAKPLAGAKLRVLMVMPVSFYNELETLIREGVELWQRLDAECIITHSFNEQVLKNDYDVIIVSHQGVIGNNWNNSGWTCINPELRKWIVDRVGSGQSGLIMVYPRNLDNAVNRFYDRKYRIDPAELLRGFPVQSMHKAVSEQYDPVYAIGDDWFESQSNLTEKVVEVYRQNNIRAVKFNYVMGPGWGTHTGLTPDPAINSAATLAHYDYWMALMARAVLYAAGREPSTKISGLEITGGKWKAVIDGLQEPATLWYRARDIWDREFAAGEVRIKSAGEVTIPGLPLPPRAVVDLILRNKRGEVLDWFSKAAPPAVKTRLTGIVLDKTYYNKGDTVTGRVSTVSDAGGKYRLQRS